MGIYLSGVQLSLAGLTAQRVATELQRGAARRRAEISIAQWFLVVGHLGGTDTGEGIDASDLPQIAPCHDIDAPPTCRHETQIASHQSLFDQRSGNGQLLQRCAWAR